MSFIVNSIKLIRPLNAIIVFATLLVVRIILGDTFETNGLEPLINIYDYMLMIIIGMWILGSGNVINDIIDQEIDKINKPAKVIIPEKISTGYALFMYWSMNALALIASMYLANKYEVISYVLVPLLAIALLFIYSKYLKKTFFFGNLAIAMLCATLPVVGFLVEGKNMEIVFLNDKVQYEVIIYQIICMISFSFILVMCRELVKDCEDVDGDRSAGAVTIPIKLGRKFSRNLMLAYLAIYICIFGVVNFFRFQLTHSRSLLLSTIVYIILVVAGVFIVYRKKQGDSFYTWMSAMIKIYLILGLLFMLIK